MQKKLYFNHIAKIFYGVGSVYNMATSEVMMIIYVLSCELVFVGLSWCHIHVIHTLEYIECVF